VDNSVQAQSLVSLAEDSVGVDDSLLVQNYEVDGLKKGQ